MYAVGEYVVRANEGIWRVSEIGHPDFQDPKEDRLYYILTSIEDAKAKIYVPTAPEPSGIRRPIRKDEALELIRNIQDIPPIDIANEKLREEQYKQSLRSNDPSQLAAIIKTLYTRNRLRTTQGKRTASIDQSYFQRAEKLLYSELAMVLGLEVISIPDLIQAVVTEKNPFENS